MSKATDAADAIRRAAKKHELFVTAAEILEQIGSLEQATAEAQAACDKALASRDLALTAQAEAEAKAEATKTHAASIVEDAHRAAGQVVQNAEQQAAAIVKEKTEAAVHTASGIRQDAERAKAKIDEQLPELREQAEQLRADIANSKAELIDLADRINGANAQYKAVQDQIRSLLAA